MAHRRAVDNEEEATERSKLLSAEPPPSSAQNKRKRSKTVPASPAATSNADSSSPTPQGQLSSSQIPPAPDAGQQKVKHRQTELRATVQRERFAALRLRRRCLSTVGIFTLLSYHKAEHQLLDSTPQPTREALFLVFFHHLVMQVDLLARLLDSNASPSGVAQSPTAPTIPTLSIDPNSREIEMASSVNNPSSGLAAMSPRAFSADISRSHTHHRNETSPLRRQISQQSSDHEEAKKSSSNSEELNLRKVLRWARETARTYLLALKLDQSQSAQRLVRHLDAHVMRLRADAADTDLAAVGSSVKAASESGTKRSSKGFKSKNKRIQSDLSKVHPLVFNPQPPKRHLVTVTQLVEEYIMKRILNPSSSEELPNKPAASKSGMLGSIMNRAQSLRRTTGPEEVSFLDPLSADQLEVLTSEAALRRDYPTHNVLCLSDIAERLSHLPTMLLNQLLVVGGLISHDPIPTLSVTAGPHISPPPAGIAETPKPLDATCTQVHSAPPMGREWANTIENDPLGLITAPYDNGLINWAFGDAQSSDENNSQIGGTATPPFQDAISAEIEILETPQASLPAEGESPPAITPVPMSVPEIDIPPASSSQESTIRSIFQLFPLHTLLFWESMYTLLLSSHWDVMVQETCKQFALSLDIAPELFDLLMAYTAEAVSEAVERSNASAQSSTTARDSMSETRSLATTSTKTLRGKASSAATRGRILKIAGMAIGVGALSALTAGIAAPAFAAGVGALGIAGTSGFATFLGTAGGSAALASLFGAGSASLSGWKYSRRLADIKTFEFHNLSSQYVVDAVATYMSEVMDLSLSRGTGAFHGPVLGLSLCSEENRSRKNKPPFQLVIGISGWLNSEEDATRPWRCVSDSLGSELFALKWEPHLLTALGAMIVRIVGEQFASTAASLTIQMTMSAGTGIILWPVSLMQYAGQLDNTWMTCRERAQQAGVLLAAALSDKTLVGHRPVTLIGYSMGSRVISFALRELYKRGEFNRVQHAILMGLPGGKSKDNWRQKRAVVSGRLVNIYCTSDWILALIYRFMEWGVQVAGLSAVEGVPGVENFDATGLVMSHNDYEKRVPELLSYIGFHSSFVETEHNKRSTKRSNKG